MMLDQRPRSRAVPPEHVFIVWWNDERMSKITAEQLREQLYTGDVHVVDIRSADDHAAGTIDGSHHLPVRDDLLAGDVEAVWNRLDGLPTDEELVFVCEMGVLSHEIASLLTGRGLSACSLEGGLRHWNATQE